MLQDPLGFFSEYLRLTGVAHTGDEPAGDPALIGKRVGIVNGSSWITLWSNYFGRKYLPGAHLINIGNEAVQVNFMEAHDRGEETPPPANIDAFVGYARDLVTLGRVDAILITCSTMNRAYRQVADAMAGYDIPVVQIDLPMMDQAVAHGGKIMVVATHGPTVESTRKLLQEAAAKTGKTVDYLGVSVDEAWHSLARGDVVAHNQALAAAIRETRETQPFDLVVLAQLSMSVFMFSHPDPESEFGVPVLTSGQCGFEHLRDVLVGLDNARTERKVT